ncbi:MAG: hypothetical protein QM783_10805 [Phycisphaerales bacterium]
MPRPTAPPAALASARAWLGLLSLDAESLAAAGVPAGSAQVMLEDLQAYLDANAQPLLAAIDAHNAASKQADSDARMLRAGKGPDEQTLAKNAAAAAAALANRTALLTGAVEAASAHLSDQQKTRLATIRLNADKEVPPAYKIVARPDHEWVELREALSAERQAAEKTLPLPHAAAEKLARLRAERTTADALANANNLLPALKQAIR